MDAAVLCGFLALYHGTMHPSLPRGDSGELMWSAWNLGVAHPPGYPLFTLLYYVCVKLFTFIGGNTDTAPLVEPAYILNGITCVIGASMCTLVFKFFAEHSAEDSSTTKTIIAVAVTSFIATRPSIWQYATETEVFGLHNFFVVTLVYCAALYHRNPKSNLRLLLGCAVAGFSMAHQHISVFLILPVALYVVAESYRQNMVRMWAVCFGVCAA
eukprot:PhF_6_TR37093/c1_g1_i3/m.54427